MESKELIDDEIILPELLFLEDYYGNYDLYIDAVYEAFKKDFVDNKPLFKGKRKLSLKKHPIYQEREYTFYHVTHTGNDEANRTPDLRRCERIKWFSPIIEKCEEWGLKVWEQDRKGKKRICIWLELEESPDVVIVLDDREKYILFWTAFTLEYNHEIKKKQKEYETYLKAKTAQR